jgi:hypothetical protein
MSYCKQYGHLAVVVYTRRWRDWFMLRYWVRCWDCDLRKGPFKTKQEARQKELDMLSLCEVTNEG